MTLFKTTLFISATLLLAACSSGTQPTDDFDFVSDESPLTILSLSPSITTTLLELGLGNQLIGVDRHSLALDNIPDQPFEVFDAFMIDLEAVLALDPDLIFTSYMGADSSESEFFTVSELAGRVHMIEPAENLDEISTQIQYIGQITNTSEVATQITTALNTEIERILGLIADFSDGYAPRVYFEISTEPSIFSFGTGVFLDDILIRLGGENVLSDLTGWVPVSEEIIIERNPDVIFTNVGYEDDPVASITTRAGWSVIDAVVNERVYLVDPQASSSSNQTIVIPIKQMATALYPTIDFE